MRQIRVMVKECRVDAPAGSVLCWRAAFCTVTC